MQTKDRIKQAIFEFISHLSPGQKADASPVRLFFITSAGIFLAEILAMAVVYDLAYLPYYQTTLIDAAIMIVLVFPFLYYFSVRPLGQYMEKYRQAGLALQQKDELQQRFLTVLMSESPIWTGTLILSRLTMPMPVRTGTLLLIISQAGIILHCIPTLKIRRSFSRLWIAASLILRMRNRSNIPTSPGAASPTGTGACSLSKLRMGWWRE